MTQSNDTLNRLATLAGISPNYWDIFGNLHETSTDAKRTILGAMGFDTSSPAAISTSYHDLEAAPWRAPLAPLQVVRRNGAIGARVVVPDGEPRTLRWRLEAETGETFDGETNAQTLPILGTQMVDGRTMAAHAVTLPEHIPDGYHRLTVETGTDAASGEIALCPAASYLPGWVQSGQRHWGLSCQIYALRGANDWGIGDLGDLRALAACCGDMGAATIGLNPLHALLPRIPKHCSPYSPSSRLFLNPLYIDILAVAEADALPPEIAASGTALRESALVDYPAVARIKESAFAHLFAAFAKRHPLGSNGQRRAAFNAFVESCGDTLEKFCLFEALHVHFDGQPWTEWPPGFETPDAPAARTFAEDHAAELEYHAYLQWIADGQLADAAGRCAQAGMAVGLYRDLAVGTESQGADAWASPGLMAMDMRFGAPPDAFNPKGQDWGLPPPKPLAMQAEGYRSFIDMMRANMRHAGALRIDHVMALQHLYWIPTGTPADEGAYVRYPINDLMGLIALESHRHRCMVIGEDLGTVPDEFRARAAKENLLSYRVLYFERHPGGLFKRPDKYPAAALATANTHDMPPISGHWLGQDLKLRAAHGLLPPGHDLEIAAKARDEERDLLLAALDDQGLRPARTPERSGGCDACAGEGEMQDLILAIERYVARTPSCLAMVSLSDALAECEMLNLPGTVDEHPNWRLRLTHTIEALGEERFVHALAEAMAEERGGSRGGSKG